MASTDDNEDTDKGILSILISNEFQRMDELLEKFLTDIINSGIVENIHK